MAVFKVETKNKVDVDKKPRVYFTCHPDDFEIHFKKVCDDIFKTHDCAIYYTEDMTEVIAEDEKQVDLGRNNLFVIPVTFKLLSTPNRAMDDDVPYALKENIPVLPIMMEPGIDEFYSKPDKFGELQYLNPYSNDLTEISYEEKLKKYLESVLISDELAKRVRDAFDAYIFLSYRKKDRKYANELMRLIHSNPECRDIAIWFDEFLTPGESFKENIEKILDDCKLFTLLVTPQLLEKVIDENGKKRDNYVISTELPLARKKKEEKGTDIFAVEMENTDKEELSTISIVDYVNPSDETFRARLLETISRMAITTNNTPEHTFLIGLAYLNGIDVEVNRERGFSLITEAANANLVEAMLWLYERSIAELNYNTAAYWQERIVEYNRNTFGISNKETLESMISLSFTYAYMYKDQMCLELREQVYELSLKSFGKKDPFLSRALFLLASAYGALGNTKKEHRLKKKKYQLSRKIFGKKHPITISSLGDIANNYAFSGRYRKALIIKKKEYRLNKKYIGTKRCSTIHSLEAVASYYGMMGKYKKQLHIYQRVYSMMSQSAYFENIDTTSTLDLILTAYLDLGMLHEAAELAEEIYAQKCNLFGEESSETLCAMKKMAMIYFKLANTSKLLEIGKKIHEFETDLREDSIDSLCWLNMLAEIYYELHEYEKELQLIQRQYQACCKILGPEHVSTIQVLVKLADTYYFLSYYEKASECLNMAYNQYREVLGENHSETLKTKNKLEKLRKAI